MLQRLYSIRDMVAAEFGPLQNCKNDAVAVRMAMGALEKASKPDDYTLWYIGTFDDELGYLHGAATEIRGVEAFAPYQIPLVVEGYVEDDPNGKA